MSIKTKTKAPSLGVSRRSTAPKCVCVGKESSNANYANSTHRNECEKRRPTVRVLFSQHVPNACHTLFTIHSLIGGNSEDFCCEENSGKLFEVLFDSGLRTEMEALVTSGQLWPDFRELKAISESKDNYYFERLLIIICLIIVLIIVFWLLFHFFWRNLLLRRESPEVTINCIQNNLRQENTNNCKLL